MTDFEQLWKDRPWWGEEVADKERARYWYGLGHKQDAADARAAIKVMEERDHAENIANKLTTEICQITGVDVGEFYNGNDPWINALEAARDYQSAMVHEAFHGSTPAIADGVGVEWKEVYRRIFERIGNRDEEMLMDLQYLRMAMTEMTGALAQADMDLSVIKDCIPSKADRETFLTPVHTRIKNAISKRYE